MASKSRNGQHAVKTIDGVTHFVRQVPLRNRRWFRAVLLLAIIVIASSAAVIISLLHHRTRSSTSQVTQITNQLSKHIILPQNEQPLIATVTDRSALKTPFLREANDGDKIVIYEKAKRVIIYRPSIDRVIDIGPVELSNIPAATSQ